MAKNRITQFEGGRSGQTKDNPLLRPMAETVINSLDGAAEPIDRR